MLLGRAEQVAGPLARRAVERSKAATPGQKGMLGTRVRGPHRAKGPQIRAGPRPERRAGGSNPPCRGTDLMPSDQIYTSGPIANARRVRVGLGREADAMVDLPTYRGTDPI